MLSSKFGNGSLTGDIIVEGSIDPEKAGATTSMRLTALAGCQRGVARMSLACNAPEDISIDKSKV